MHTLQSYTCTSVGERRFYIHNVQSIAKWKEEKLYEFKLLLIMIY